MKTAIARLVIGLVAVGVGAVACRQSDPGLDPKTPPNQALPTKLTRPDDPPASPLGVPKVKPAAPDGGL